MEGYIKIYRKIFDSNLRPRGRFSRFEAWVYLLCKANGIKKRWIGIDVERGSFATSQLELSKEFKWATGTINLFFSYLKAENRIETKTTNKYTIVTIKNYDIYNPPPNRNENKNENNMKTTRKQHETTNKDNKDNKDNIHMSKARELITKYNFLYGKNLISFQSITKNLEFWLGEGYRLEDMYKALEMARFHPFYKSKITPEMLLRRKNTRGEDVDRIGELKGYIPEKGDIYKSPDGRVFTSEQEWKVYMKSRGWGVRNG